MIPYHDNIEDKEYPDIKWFCYGEPTTNELHIWAKYKDTVYKRIVKSPVNFPAMSNRIWGIDVMDEAKARKVSEQIFDEDLKPILGIK